MNTTADKIKELLKDKSAIEQWLLDKRPNEIVGYPKLDCACPISRFLSEQGFGTIAIGNSFDLSSFSIMEDDKPVESHDLPDFAQSLAEAIDSCSFSLTAFEVMLLLEKCSSPEAEKSGSSKALRLPDCPEPSIPPFKSIR